MELKQTITLRVDAVPMHKTASFMDKQVRGGSRGGERVWYGGSESENVWYREGESMSVWYWESA